VQADGQHQYGLKKEQKLVQDIRKLIDSTIEKRGERTGTTNEPLTEEIVSIMNNLEVKANH